MTVEANRGLPANLSKNTVVRAYQAWSEESMTGLRRHMSQVRTQDSELVMSRILLQDRMTAKHVLESLEGYSLQTVPLSALRVMHATAHARTQEVFFDYLS